MEISIIPPQLHINFEESLSAGILLRSTVGQPGAQGAEVTGIQGMGVNAPIAAAVADATVGFAIELHIAKGKILTIGALSIILANGIDVIALFAGSTIKEEGAAPKLHFNIAPPQTKLPMIKPFLGIFF